jgi:hypothetical protein
MERWIRQACRSAETTGTYSWLLITRRDRRHPMIWMDNEIVTAVEHKDTYLRQRPHLECTWYLDGFSVTIFGLLLKDFLGLLNREIIEELALAAEKVRG